MSVTFRDLLYEAAAAGASIIPVFHAFRVKTQQQLDRPIPRFVFNEALRKGSGAALLTGPMIGVQRVVQKYSDEELQTMMGCKQNVVTACLSGAISGVVTTPLVVMFTALTNGKKLAQSVRDITPKQVMATAGMEAGFLAGMGAANPAIGYFRRKFGSSTLVDYFATFFSGSLGALAGHACDTAVTVWNNGSKVQCLSHLSRGVFVRVSAVGAYSCFYKLIMDQTSQARVK